MVPACCALLSPKLHEVTSTERVKRVAWLHSQTREETSLWSQTTIFCVDCVLTGTSCCLWEDWWIWWSNRAISSHDAPMRPVTLLAWGILLTFATIGVYDTFHRYATSSDVLSPFSGRIQHLSGRQPWRFSGVSNSQMSHRDLDAVDYEIINFKSFSKYIKLSSFSVSIRM